MATQCRVPLSNWIKLQIQDVEEFLSGDVTVLSQDNFCCGKLTSPVRPRAGSRSGIDSDPTRQQQEFIGTAIVFRRRLNVFSGRGKPGRKIIRLFAYKLPKVVPFVGRIFSRRLPGGVSLHGQKFRPLDTGNG